MKKALFVFTILISAEIQLKAQTTFPTNREVYNFSVGDTFIYNAYYHDLDPNCPIMYAYQCSHDYYVIVTSKSFSSDSNTVYYTYMKGGWSSNVPIPIYDSYTNLDSVVILPPYPNAATNEIDTAYIDTAHYCIPRLIATKHNRYGLSDFFKSIYASGLGMVEDSYWHDQGSSPSGDYSWSLVHFHKGNIICGSYDSTKLVSTINQIEPDTRLKLYPNPATNILYVDGLAGNKQYFIFDVTGRICMTAICQSEILIDKLPSGIYYIKIATGKNIVLEKFIKQE